MTGVTALWLLLTLAVWGLWSAVARYRKTPDYLAWQKHQDELRQQAAAQAEKNAARQHLARFYHQHKDLLAPVPPALLAAFIRSAMPDSLDPTQLWDIAHNKIAELQALMEKERAAQEEGHLDARICKLRADHERRIAALRTLGDSLDPESREAIELERLIEEAMTRFRTQLQQLNKKS